MSEPDEEQEHEASASDGSGEFEPTPSEGATPTEEEASEDDWEYDDGFPLLDLPTEIQLQIFQALPDLWTVISLRLTCHALNDLYTSCEKGVIAALREKLVAPFEDYLRFHVTLHLDEADLRLPPPDGWPDIDQVNCRGWNKSDLVLDVVRHLPYIEQDGLMDDEHLIDYKCNIIDYSKCKPGDKYLGYVEDNVIDEFEELARWHTVAIGYGWESGGVVIVLDTMTGNVYEEHINCENLDPKPVEEYLDEKREDFEECYKLIVPGYGVLDVRASAPRPYDAQRIEEEGEPAPWHEVDSAEGYNWVRHLYRKFGWGSENWRKKECLDAVRAFRANRIE